MEDDDDIEILPTSSSVTPSATPSINRIISEAENKNYMSVKEFSERLLTENAAGAVWTLPETQRRCVAVYVKQLFYWFASLKKVEHVTNIVNYLDLGIPFPVQKDSEPGLFKRELAGRAYAFYQKNKDIAQMEQFFCIDDAQCVFATLHRALEIGDQSFDFLPLLKEYELDRDLYAFLFSVVLSHVPKQSHPATLVSDILLSPKDIVILLVVVYFEATFGPKARINWAEVKVSASAISVESLIEFDHKLTLAANQQLEGLQARKTNLEDLSTQLSEQHDKLAQQMDDLNKVQEQIGLQNNGFREQIGRARTENRQMWDERGEVAKRVLDPHKLAALDNDIIVVEEPSMNKNNEAQKKKQHPGNNKKSDDLAVQFLSAITPYIDAPERLTRDALKMEPGARVMVRLDSYAGTPFIEGQFVKYIDNVSMTVRIYDGDVEMSVLTHDVANMETRMPLLSEGVRVCARGLNIYTPEVTTPKFYSGTIATRLDAQHDQYLVFFDDCFEAYAMRSTEVFVMCQQALDPNDYLRKDKVYECVSPRKSQDLFNRPSFIKRYFERYPDWQLVRMRKFPPGQRVSCLSRQKHQWSAFVIDVDRAMCRLRFNPLKGDPGVRDCIQSPCMRHNHSEELIYRGSDRFNAQHQEQPTAGGAYHRRRRAMNQPISYEPAVPDAEKLNSRLSDLQKEQQSLTSNKKMHKNGQRLSSQIAVPIGRSMTMRKKQPHFKLRRHHVEAFQYNQSCYHSPCGSECLGGMDRNPNHPNFFNVSRFFVPLQCGWRRHASYERKDMSARRMKATKYIYYRAPCGRPFYNEEEIIDYLDATQSELHIDCFTFEEDVRVCRYAYVPENFKLTDDFAEGKEGRPIPAVNDIDQEGLPINFNYRSRRFPYDDRVNIQSVSKNFCSGCTCVGDCRNSRSCECQMLTKTMTLRLAHALRLEGIGMYHNRRLPMRTLAGLYECNANCQCSTTRCFNRVVQQTNLRVPLQLFKTAGMGWGVRTLCDLPAGTFVCNYHGALLIDELAENLGVGDDDYFADIDLVAAVENEKLGAGTDMMEDQGIGRDSSDDEEGTRRDEEEEDEESEDDTVDFIESYGPTGRRRKKKQRPLDESEKVDARVQDAVVPDGSLDETPSDENRKSVFDKYFTEQGCPNLYIVDAKMQGNIGRFFNHSCEPNMLVQHVLVDTHDLRLPWVAFFTRQTVKAGEELSWDYGWTPIEGQSRNVRCQCGAPSCRGLLL